MVFSKLFNKAQDRTIEIDIEGMTCENCVRHARKALESLENVKNVDIILNSGGLSRATVVTDIELDNDAISSAIADAGYTVKDIRRDV